MRFFSTLFGSFHSPETYRTVRYEARGWGLFYAFLLVAITSLIGVLWLTFFLHKELLVAQDGQPPLADSLIMQVAEQMPEIRIENDTLEVIGAEQPLTIYVHGSFAGYPFATDFITIDTSGKTNHRNMTTIMLVTAKEIISTTKEEQKIRSISELTKNTEQPIHWTREDIENGAQTAVTMLHTNMWKVYLMFIPFLWAGICFVFFITRLVMLLALGVVAMMLGNIGRGTMEYMTAVRLASAAYTPVAVFNALAFVLAMQTANTLPLFGMGVLMLAAVIYVTHEARQ